MITSNGFRCVSIISKKFSKSIQIKDMELRSFMLIINMRILYTSDHELGVHKSVDYLIYRLFTQKRIYGLRFFECFSQTPQNLQ